MDPTQTNTPSVRLRALKTKAPPFSLDQRDVLERVTREYRGQGEVERLLPVFMNTGIERRHSCVPVEWYYEPHGWADRTTLFLQNAQALLQDASEAVLAEAALRPEDIDTIVVVSTTGVATPSLDARLVEAMKLRRDIQRLPIFGLGCAGGVIGLARAADLARARPGSIVLFLVVELCALTFRKDDPSSGNIVATALFGDGAAAAILSTDGPGPKIGAAREHTWPGSLDVMGWDVKDDGLKARFSQSIPSIVSREFRTVLDAYLEQNGLARRSFDAFACHPGGAKVLDALEDVFELERGALIESREVLRSHGNMSAPTALFVLERIWADRGKALRILLSAFGPGFSAALVTIDGR